MVRTVRHDELLCTPDLCERVDDRGVLPESSTPGHFDDHPLTHLTSQMNCSCPTP